VPFDAARERFIGKPGWVVEAIPAGHDVMLDAPEDLTVELVAAAARAGLA
jgi:hypothetical protein